MSLPALTRTWQFQVNQAAAAGGTGLAACQNLMFAIKQSLKGVGAWTDSSGGAVASAGNWVVDYSCDSVSAGAKGDGVDKWAASTNLVWAASGVAHSWIVLKQTGISANFELLISLENGTVSNATILVSSVGFTGGTTLLRPSATDETPLLNPAGTSTWGGVNAATASTLHVLKSNDGRSTRILACRNGFVPLYAIIELPTETSVSYANPVLGCWLGDGTAAPGSSQPVYANLSNAANAYGRTTANYAWFMTAPGDVLHGLLGITQTVANDLGACFAMYENGAYSLTPNSRGRDAKLVDHWTGSTALADSDTFPAAGTRNFCVFGDTIQPWNTSAPTFGGGASTARDGELVTLGTFASAAYLEPQAGGPDAATTSTGSVAYLMEAWDSVTGLQVTWFVQSPDFAGTFYPGPNSPTNIAIAAVIPP
jgi:hypothetical protein